jgi:hypothetical protein
MGQVQRVDANDVCEGRRESGEDGVAASIAGDGASSCMVSETSEREWWMRGAEEREDERERQEASVIVGAELPKPPATSFLSHPPRAFARLLSAPPPPLFAGLVRVPPPRVSARNKGEQGDHRGGGEEWRRARARTKE